MTPASRLTRVLPECVFERVPHGDWHACKGEGSDTFQPILCSDQEGINMPGPRVQRQPTCVPCYAAWRQEATHA